MAEALKANTLDACRANAEDPLHAAFTAKAVVHSGPGGMPLMGADAERTLDGLLDTPRKDKTLAYLHVPFCETRCLYCLFYQNPYKEEAVSRYAKALVKEIELWSDRAAVTSHPVHAVYFGGGTPTAFSPDDLRLVIGAVKKYLPLANDCEITVEGRIHGFTDEKIEAALEAGANRFSLGVQTFNTDIRRSMMRVDDRDTILARLDKLCSYDNASVVMDLIYGFPGQTMDVWADDVKTAASLPLDGIDCYQLNVFERSPLAKYVANGKLPPAADTAQKADMFAMSVEMLTNAHWRRLSNNHWGNGTRERNIYNALGKGASDCLAFGCGAGGRLHGHSFMMERKLDAWYAQLEAASARPQLHDGAKARRLVRAARGWQEARRHAHEAYAPLASSSHRFVRNGIGLDRPLGDRLQVQRSRRQARRAGRQSVGGSGAARSGRQRLRADGRRSVLARHARATSRQLAYAAADARLGPSGAFRSSPRDAGRPRSGTSEGRASVDGRRGSRGTRPKDARRAFERGLRPRSESSRRIRGGARAGVPRGSLIDI